MRPTDTTHFLSGILTDNLEEETFHWISVKLQTILSEESARDLYLAYTLMGTKIPKAEPEKYTEADMVVTQYLQAHGATLLEIARIYLLRRALEEKPVFFAPKVAQLIQLADTSELITFLRYLVWLPQAGDFRQVAVEALRTNVATVFDAIALDNPYPSLHFNQQEWNQMYLKAAFMQRDLGKIRDVDSKANQALARIISDYAHERWAAGREVDPLFWRPVTHYLEGVLLEDMKRLLHSPDISENRAGALCCHRSGNAAALALLEEYPTLKKAVESGAFDWNTLNE